MGVNSCGTTLMDQGVFKNIGAITWDTTVKTSGFTAVSGNGYFCNTTSAAFTVTLPSSPSAGDVVAIADYANTFDTNIVTIGRNGSNIQGQAADFKAQIEGLSITLIYVDGTQGWLSIDAAQANDIEIPPAFITATGGTITTVCTNYKVHTFTGPGTFTVCSVGNPQGSDAVDYLVVAGGGGAGAECAGGGGAGGFRTSFPSPAGVISVSATGYPITVGAGGAGNTFSAPYGGCNGVNSIFSSITSTGGGGGGGGAGPRIGADGGSGGGAGGPESSPQPSAAGSGNTPPVSPSQGNNGGAAHRRPSEAGGGGGGAGAVGGAASAGNGGNGGNGTANSINGSSVTRGGGGGGGTSGTGGTGGSGGGGDGRGSSTPGENATTNTGGGGGAGGGNAVVNGGNGGSGIVIIRYKFQ
jgi:hypothetical protein